MITLKFHSINEGKFESAIELWDLSNIKLDAFGNALPN